MNTLTGNHSRLVKAAITKDTKLIKTFYEKYKSA